MCPPSCGWLWFYGKMDIPPSSKEVTQEGTSGDVVLSRAVPHPYQHIVGLVWN